jgi:hypothetical protein
LPSAKASRERTSECTLLVVKDGSHYWASSDLSLTVSEVKAIYRLRQQIEETFKILKSQLRWGKCPGPSKTAQAMRQGTTVYRLRRCLCRQAIPLQSPLLQPFRVAA